MTRRKWTSDEEIRLLHMIASGKTVTEAAAALGRTDKDVGAMNRKHEIQRARLREIARRISAKTRSLPGRDASGGHGPFLHVRQVSRDQAEQIIGLMLPKTEDEK
jgi:hypothetical protein